MASHSMTGISAQRLHLHVSPRPRSIPHGHTPSLTVFIGPCSTTERACTNPNNDLHLVFQGHSSPFLLQLQVCVLRTRLIWGG